MVSPRKAHVDAENAMTSYAPGLAMGLKNNLLQVPSTQPLGDVRNTLGSVRNLLKYLSEEDSKNKKKDSELKPVKCTLEAVSVVKENMEEPLDPVWDAPLAYNNWGEDCYYDIIPLSLQLTDEEISRFVLNKPRPLSDKSTFKWRDDDDDYVLPTLDFYFDPLGYGSPLKFDDDLPDVPLPPFEDSYSDGEF